MTDLHYSLLSEIFNIGVGKAAAALSRLNEDQDQVHLSVPQLLILDLNQLLDEATHNVGDDVSMIKQDYKGPFEGVAVLLYSQIAGLQLVRMMLGHIVPFDRLTELETDALCEVGNIVLNASLATMASLFKVDIETSMPEIRKGRTREVLSHELNQVKAQKVLYLKMGFEIHAKEISGFVTLLLASEKLDALFRCLDAYHQRIVSGEDDAVVH